MTAIEPAGPAAPHDPDRPARLLRAERDALLPILHGPRGIPGKNPAVTAEQAPVLTVRDQWDDGTATVTVRGEIDAATADAFYQRLADVASGSPRRLVIDLAGVDFLDSSGLRAFVRLRKALP